MGQAQDSRNITEKNRTRDEIDEQIREYLKRGGKIDVLSGNQAKTGNTMGSVWHGPEDIPGPGR